jgi:hypothetical protein
MSAASLDCHSIVLPVSTTTSNDDSREHMQREIARICVQLKANDPTGKYIDHLVQAEAIFDRQERMRIGLEQAKLASVVAALPAPSASQSTISPHIGMTHPCMSSSS